MSIKQKQLTLPVVKDLPPQLAERQANSDTGLWVWASREVVDQTGDVIRIDGITLTPYHDPDNGSRLKILAQHIRALPDGKAAVVGVVTDYAKTITTYNGALAPALALYVEWLRDPESGELLELAAHYQQMVASGGIDSVSVGVILDEYERTDTGLDITACTLYECSFVSIPANASATLIKELAAAGYEITPAAMPMPDDDEPDDDDCTPTYYITADQVKAVVNECLTPIQDTLGSLNKTLAGVADRLDVLESALVVLTQSAGSEKDNQTADPKELQALDERLSYLLKYLGK